MNVNFFFFICILVFRIWVHMDPHLFWSAGSESRRAKMANKGQKNRKKSLLRAEGFSCSLGVFYVGQGISKLQFLILKILIFLFPYKFFPIFGHQNPGSGSVSGSGFALRIRIDLKCRIRIRIETNVDLKHYFYLMFRKLKSWELGSLYSIVSNINI